MKDKSIATAIVGLLVLCGCVGLFMATTPASADGPQEDAPWPVFRGNIRNTGLSPYDTRNNTGNLIWKFETNDEITSSPVIDSNGTIYVGSYDYDFYAVYPNGTLKWKFRTDRHIVFSPAIDSNGTIYVGSVDSPFYAFYPNGSLKWKFNVWTHSSPTIGLDGTIYVGARDYLYAINPDGMFKWRFFTNAAVRSTPAIDTDGTLYFGCHNYFYALFPNGTLKWEYATKETTVSYSTALALDGSLYFGTDYHLFALHTNGSFKWKYSTPTPVYSSPAIGSDGTIYVNHAYGGLMAMNPDGTVKWTRNVYLGWSSPSIGADGTIYVGSHDQLPGHLHAIYPNGTIKWSFETDGRIYSAPAIDANGTVYVGSLDWFLYSVGVSNSGENRPPVADAGPNQNAVVNQTVYLDGCDSYDPNGVALSYRWDFGDGISSGWQGDCRRSHSYTTIGNYTANLTVSDGLLFDTDSCLIHILEGDQSPPSDPPEVTRAWLSGVGLQNVTLEWSASDNDTGAGGIVERYDILHSSSFHPDGNGYSLLASVPAVGAQTYSYEHLGGGEGDPLNHFYMVCAVNALNAALCADSQAAKFTHQLANGPKLISIPLVQSNESVEHVLQTVKYDKAWNYDSLSGEWKWYTKHKGYRRGLWSMNHTDGIWVDITGDCNLTVAGIVPAQTTIYLYKGWNLVSFPSFDTTYTVADLKAEIGATRVEGMEGYDLVPPYFLIVLGDTKVPLAGYGYWVNVDTDVDWIIETS